MLAVVAIDPETEIAFDLIEPINATGSHFFAQVREQINAGNSEGELVDQDGEDAGSWNIC